MRERLAFARHTRWRDFSGSDGAGNERPGGSSKITSEGLLVGGSSGSAVWGTLEAIKRYPNAKRALTILPDSIRNYLSKFVSKKWMIEHGFMEADA